MELFLSQGIKRTAIDEIAARAGVTRVTVYRYFEDKRQLVREVFLYIVAVFQRVQTSIYQAQEVDVEAALDEIESGLAALPGGDLPTRLDELKRVYPKVFTEFHDTRTAVVKKIFDRLFKVCRQRGILREDLSQEIVEVYFLESVINLVENPRLVALSLSPAKIYANVKDIFLHGILKESKK